MKSLPIIHLGVLTKKRKSIKEDIKIRLAKSNLVYLYLKGLIDGEKFTNAIN